MKLEKKGTQSPKNYFSKIKDAAISIGSKSKSFGIRKPHGNGHGAIGKESEYDQSSRYFSD